jgi:hypothetical protein
MSRRNYNYKKVNLQSGLKDFFELLTFFVTGLGALALIFAIIVTVWKYFSNLPTDLIADLMRGSASSQAINRVYEPITDSVKQRLGGWGWTQIRRRTCTSEIRKTGGASLPPWIVGLQAAQSLAFVPRAAQSPR